MESFQQSGLNTSRESLRTRAERCCGAAGRWVESAWESTRAKAMMSDMVPLRISFMRTAVAAEYSRDAGVDTRE